MGFCRRCGDIVVGPRCSKCGGTSVAPAVKWNVGDDDGKQDKWSKTYVTKSGSTKSLADTSLQPSYTGSNTGHVKCFPRPLGSTNNVKPALSSRVSAHIASATNNKGPSSLKHRASIDPSMVTESHAEQGILPSPHGSELAKVYGSVLQPKETLASFSCAICSTVFSPDATIYPDPSSINTTDVDGMPFNGGTRFLCKPCFTMNGGSRGDCPTCRRPVLILKSEGGFVETSGQVWHKKCFCCEGCGANLGNQPMVDLLGRPCCVECFDTCLKRPSGSTDSPARLVASGGSKTGNFGGTRVDKSFNKEREGSPTLEELEARLGIAKGRETTPNLISVGRINMASHGSPFGISGRESTRRYSAISLPPTEPPLNFESELCDVSTERLSQNGISLNDASPLPRARSRRSRSRPRDSSDFAEQFSAGSSNTPRKQPTEEAIEEMKRRFLSGKSSPAVTPVKASVASSPSTTPRRQSRSRSRPRASFGETESQESPRNLAIRKTVSTASLRSSQIRPQQTGDTGFGSETDLGTESERGGFTLIPDRTGDSTQPLRPRRNRTGDSEYTEIGGDLTGATATGFSSTVEQSVDGSFSTDDDILDMHKTVRPVRTGGIAFGYEPFEDIPNPICSHRTADTKTPPRQRTGGRHGRVHSIGDTGVCGQMFEPHATSKQDLRDNPVKPALPASSSLDCAAQIPAQGLENSFTSLKGSIQGLSLGHQSGSFSTSSVASSGYESSISSTPDLASDCSDATSSRSSLPSTPLSTSPPHRGHGKFSLGSDARSITPTRSKRAQTFSHLIGLSIPEEIPPDARCEKCHQPLFNTRFGGKFVTVPEEPSSTGALPKRYHTACFRCRVCGEAFEEKEGGHAVFVRVPEGACHVRCAPPEKITLRKTPPAGLFKPSKIPVASSPPDRPPANTDTRTAFYSSSSRYERPPTAPPATTPFPIQPRFGGSTSCPGCRKAVSPMERGVVPGPQGSKWHGGCLICGGQEAKGRRRQGGKAGCGKKLDSAAKLDADGCVWCRECLLLLPPTLRQASTVGSPVTPMATGNSSALTRVAPQATGTTIARQFTGIGGAAASDAELLRQLTGGGSSPARQLTSSPTKLYDGPRPGRVYPRPKSVTGTRSTGGEGRGMFLVRQLTGGNSSFSGNEYGL